MWSFYSSSSSSLLLPLLLVVLLQQQGPMTNAFVHQPPKLIPTKIGSGLTIGSSMPSLYTTSPSTESIVTSTAPLYEPFGRGIMEDINRKKPHLKSEFTGILAGIHDRIHIYILVFMRSYSIYNFDFIQCYNFALIR